MQVYAPFSGQIIALTDVPDAAYAERMLGDGLAIESHEEESVMVTAPINGIVISVNKNCHALVIRSEEGIELLLHMGVDTVMLGGKGFKTFVRVGSRVKVGDNLLEANLKYIRAKAVASMLIVVVSNAPEAVARPSTEGEVEVSDKFFSVDVHKYSQSSSWEYLI